MTKFKRGDQVRAKDTKRHPFWFTVTSATSTRVYCKFGSEGEYAGSFTFDEVEPYNQATKK